MKFLVGECPPGGLLLHPLYPGADVMHVWERYQWILDPAVFAGIVWRVVDAKHVQAAAEIVRSTPSYPVCIVKPDHPKGDRNVSDDGSNRSNGDDWRRQRQPGDRGRGRITSNPRTQPGATGNPWD